MTENNVVQKPGLQLWKWNSELYNTNNPPRLGNLGRHKSLKSLPINRKSEQTMSNTLWKKYKAFLLWAFLYFYLLKPIVNIHIFQPEVVRSEKENFDWFPSAVRILQKESRRLTAHEFISANCFLNSLHKITVFWWVEIF